MDDSKISTLPPSGSVNGGDLLVIVNENQTCKITVDTLFSEVSAINGSIRLQGDWDASSGNPPTSSTTPIPTGFAWRVSVVGNTNLGGITDWIVGDLAVKTDSSWLKISSKDIGAIWGNITGNIGNQSDLNDALITKITSNSPITGATNTKITFDEKGLVTAGVDATTDDISEGNNNLYYTDARVIAIGDDRYDTKGQLDSLHNLGLLQGNIEDFGKTWTKVNVDVNNINSFQAVYHICSLGNGIILAGSYGGNDYGIKVYRSKDYGKTFPETFQVDTSPEHVTFQLLSLGGGIVLCASGYQTNTGNIYRSTDYGVTWTKIVIDVYLNDTFCFCDLGNGVVLCGTAGAAGEGVVWKSADYGVTWVQKTIDPNLTMIPSISYLGGNIVICASNNNIYKSIDAGNTWSLLYSTNSDAINTTAYLGNGIVVFGTESGKLYRSSDFGATWTVKSASTSIRFITYIGCGLTFYSSSGAPGAKQAKLFKSKNNGSTWEEVITPFSSQIDYALRMCYVGNSLMFIGVGDYSAGQAAIYRSCLIEPTDITANTSEIINISNISYASLVTAISNSTLNPGSYYRITDYQTIHVIPGTGTLNTGVNEPLIVLALTNNTLSTQAYSETNPQDLIEYDITKNLAENGTHRNGYITYRRDTVNDIDCYFDFRQCKFSRNASIVSMLADNVATNIHLGVGSFDIVFGINCSGNILGGNCSNITFGNNCTNNAFSNHCFNNTFGNNCSNITLGSSCYSILLGNDCTYNTFGDACYTIAFGYSCSNNIFGNTCYNSNFGNNCSNNVFGNTCFSITFGNGGSNNTFGIDCYSDAFGVNCSGNIFGDGCCSNTFGDNCGSDTFGNNCNGNTFGNGYSGNTFGTNCNGNTFGVSCTGNKVLDGCNSNHFGDGCASNSFGFSCNGNTFGINCLDNTFVDNFNGNTFGINCCNNTFGKHVVNQIFPVGFSNNVIGFQNIDLGNTNIVNLANGVNASDAVNKGQLDSINKTSLGLNNVTNDLQVKASEKGVANGVAQLDSAGKVPASQLPSFVDDVLEFASLANFPQTGEDSKIYIALESNLTYRWSGSIYVEISPSLALGTTSSTATPGDKGNIAYLHSQIISGNPHGTTASQIGAPSGSGVCSGINTGDQDLSGLVPNTRKINNKPLSSDITLTASDINAPSGSGSSTGTNTGDETIQRIGNIINLSTEKTPSLANNDMFAIWDSVSSILKKFSYQNLVAAFTSLFEPKNSNIQAHISSTSNPHQTTLEQVRSQNNQIAGNIDANQNTIINIKNPTNAQDAANKQWVEAKQINTQNSITGGGDLSANRTLQLVNDAASPSINGLYGINNAGVKGWYNLPPSIQTQFNLINGNAIQSYDDYLYIENAQRSGNDSGLNSNAAIPFMIPVDCILIGAEFYIGYVGVGGTYAGGSVAINFKINSITQTGITTVASISTSVTGTTSNIGSNGNFAANALAITSPLTGLNTAFSAGQMIGLKFIHDTTSSPIIAASIKYVVVKLLFRPKI